MTFNLGGLVEIIFAYLYFIIGVGLALNPKHWIKMIDSIRKEEGSMFGMGLWALTIGLVIVMTHNDWSWSPSVIVTIIGWLALIKFITYFWFPGALWKLYDILKPYYTPRFLRIDGVVISALMLWVILSYHGAL